MQHLVGLNASKMAVCRMSGGLAKGTEEEHYSPKISGGIRIRSRVEEPVMYLMHVCVLHQLFLLTGRNAVFGSLQEKG
jgi:hypothetical protein